MKKLIVLSLAALPLLATTAQAEMRCGWIENPTPGNYWLTDRDASWVISAQGGYEAPGMEMIGDISAGDYVATNGNYGYGCACMDVMTDPNEKQITMIHSFKQLAISKCENDKNLPAVE
ncbi:DUF4087 domain-containing protein [Rhizobium alvei]|uniref:DUF4087 domain-containing protein n=1 Tax=Rhizobium alvei TaxID=1132659 RepID=A0ABT8YI98_9HYPH|nr:DUF4087 domain-containing protein [Rhizobium alvei]MDO6963421.1 DUF4087 domain-containing protein [Rhizobium alvei]